MSKCEKCGTTWLDVRDPALQSPCPSCENKRLRDKLPKTADGVPLVAGMTVFAETGRIGTVVAAFRILGLAERPFYSTREAAEQAQKESR